MTIGCIVLVCSPQITQSVRDLQEQIKRMEARISSMSGNSPQVNAQEEAAKRCGTWACALFATLHMFPSSLALLLSWSLSEAVPGGHHTSWYQKPQSLEWFWLRYHVCAALMYV